MTCHTENNQFELAMELLIENGFDGIAGAMTILLNAAMKIERSRSSGQGHMSEMNNVKAMQTATSRKRYIHG